MEVINRTSGVAPFHFAFEEVDNLYWMNLTGANNKLVYFVGLGYVGTIMGLQWWMKSRPPLDLKWLLVAWNLALSVFAIFGFIRTFPLLVNVLGKEHGLYKSVCTESILTIPMACWTLLFSLSKFWELGDTLFIVLRKKPLIFLQWYHHVMTMVVTWLVAPYYEPVVRWYIVLNFGVHSLMYPYFAMRAMGKRVPSLIAYLILTLEIGQMIVGLSANMLSMYFQKAGHDCNRHPTSIQLFGMLYGSFLLLFGKLFYDYVVAAKTRKYSRPERQKID